MSDVESLRQLADQLQFDTLREGSVGVRLLLHHQLQGLQLEIQIAADRLGEAEAWLERQHEVMEEAQWCGYLIQNKGQPVRRAKPARDWR